mgnify:CR=1 FL=1
MPRKQTRTPPRLYDDLERSGRLRIKTFLWGAGAISLMALAGYLTFASGGTTSIREWTSQQIVHLTAISGFTTQNIYLQGRINAKAADLLSAVQIKRDDPLFSRSPADIQQDLIKNTWIEYAQVERHLPDTIYIRVIEREPVALWQQHGVVHVIDAKGRVLTDDLKRFAHLPLVVGTGANTAAAPLIAYLRAELELTDRLQAATWISGRRWDLYFKDHVIVKLPEENMGLAIKKLADAQSKDQILEKQISSIDLRTPDRIIVAAPTEEYQQKNSSQESIHPVSFTQSGNDL